MTQKYNEEELKNMVPVFHLKPTSSSRVRCTLRGYSEKEERLFDDQLEVETTDEIKEKVGNNTLLLGTVNKHIIIGKYCSCNIPGGYLIQNAKMPVFYLSIIYTKPLITGCLFNMFLYFEMDDECKARMDNPKKYYKAYINGKYTIHCVPTDDDLLIKIKPLVEQEVMLEYKEKFDKIESGEQDQNQNQDQDQDQLMEEVIDKIQEKMGEYEKFFESIDFEEDRIPTQKTVFRTLNKMCDNPIFKELVSYGLISREHDRIAERGDPDIEYKIPKNIINLREIKENPDRLDEIMANREVSDEDE